MALATPEIQIYKRADGEVSWRLVARNGEIVLPPEGHRDATDAARAIGTVRALMIEAIIVDKTDAAP